MPKKTGQHRKTGARSSTTDSNAAGRTYDEVDDRITIPVASSSAPSSSSSTTTTTASSAVLLSGIDKYRNLKGRSSSSSSAAPTVDKASVHATFKSGMVAAVRSSSTASSSVSASTSPLVKEPPLERAQRLVEQKQFAAALPFFTEALHASSASAQTKLTLFFQRGTCALSARRFKQAVEDFTYVINLTPSNALLLARRAKAYAALHQHEAALHDYDAAILMTPPTQAELRTLLLARAAVYVHMGSYSLALDDLRVAQTQTYGGDRDPALFYQRAQLHTKRQQPRSALADLDTFMELQEDWTSTLNDNKEMEKDTEACAPPEPEDGGDDGRRLVDVRMERATLLLQLAKEADDVRRKDAAVIATEEGEQQPLLSEMPRDYQTSSATTTSTRRRQSQAPSSSSFSMPSPPVSTSPKKKKKPSTFDTMGYRGADAIAFVERAVDDYTQILASDPGHSDALRLRGESLALIGRPQDALRDFDAALVLDVHDFHVQMARAKLLFALREIPQAIAEMTRVLEVNGFFVDALFLRAEMYEAMEEFDKAKRDYTSIMNAELETKSMGSADGHNKKGGMTALSGGGGGSTGLGGKVTNEYSVQALLLRARLCQALDDFDGAASDYKRILESFPNHMEAQYELQENDEKRDAFEKQRELDAVAWLVEEERRREQELLGHNGGAGNSGGGTSGGGVGSGNGGATGTGKNKKKKKAKKKKGTGVGTTPTASETADTEADAAVTGDEDDVGLGLAMEKEKEEEEDVLGESVETERQQSNGVRPTTRPPRIETSDNVNGLSGRRRRSPSSSPSTKTSASDSGELTNKTSSLSIVVTRDEACESMWEDHPDEVELSLQLRARGTSPLSGGGNEFYPIRLHADTDDDTTLRIPHAPTAPTVTSEDDEPDVEEPTPLESESTPGAEEEEDASEDAVEEHDQDLVERDTPTKASTPSHVAIRERLVDEKYLKKRQKQLDKLRSQLLEASETRNEAVLEETMARVERKQMNESMEHELTEATRVLKEIKAEAMRVQEEHHKEERYRQQEIERERRRRQDEKEKELQHQRQRLQPQAVDTRGIKSASLSSPLSIKSSGTPPTTASQENDSMRKSTTPSLVIRPIAYSHALHVAEQHQQQVLQYQRLVHEKDAEIAFLRRLLSQQSASPTTISDADDELYSSTAVAKLVRENHFSKTLVGRLDALIESMSPSAEADDTRFRILSFVRRVLERHWSSSMGLTLALPPPLLFVATGSFPMKTYLPTADLDVTLFLPKELEPTWHFAVLNALCMAGTSGSDDGGAAIAKNGGSINGSPDGKTTSVSALAGASSTGGLSSHTVRNVTVINAEVRVVKCTIDNVSVDLTANRVGALGALLLLDAMDLRVGHDHLLKRSLVLIKSWCFYESSAYASGATGTSTNQGGVLGASTGGLTTYAINTIVMSLFNQHAASITHPLHALLLFLDRMAAFPWHESALTLFGAVPLSVLATSGSLAVALDKLAQQSHTASGGRGRTASSNTETTKDLGPSMAILTLDDVEQIRRHVHEQFGALDPSFVSPLHGGAAAGGTVGSTLSGSASTTPGSTGASGFKALSFPIRACNVVDPLDDQNNLARSVSLDVFPSMKRVFTLGRNRLVQVLSSAADDSTAMDTFFATCWKTYGRGDGWRPDLLVHPRQTWHARATTTSKDVLYEHKWQSLLPEFLMAPSPMGPMGPGPSDAYVNDIDPYAPYPLHPHVPPGSVTATRQHHGHHYAHPHQPQHQQHMANVNTAMGNGSTTMNGHGHHFQPTHSHNHNSPSQYLSHRSTGASRTGTGSGGYDDRSRVSPTTTAHGYKSSPRRAQSLSGSGSSVAAGVSVANSAAVNGNGYPVEGDDYTRSGGSNHHLKSSSRRYDSPTTVKHAASHHSSK